MQPEELKAMRQRIGMTQGQLGEALGLTGTFIGLMERGVKPIERRTDLAVRQLVSETMDRVRQHGFHVEPAQAVDGWNVIFVHDGWRGVFGQRQIVMYGHFSNERHANRWAAALETARRPRMQSRLDDVIAAAWRRIKDAGKD